MSNEYAQKAFDWWNELTNEAQEELVIEIYCQKHGLRME